jgi:hypothetical protein
MQYRGKQYTVALSDRHLTKVSLERSLHRFFGCLTHSAAGGNSMKQSEIFRENAENCAHLAEAASSEPAFLRYKRMEAAWRSLADEQDWLDGEIPPVEKASGRMDESHENP